MLLPRVFLGIVLFGDKYLEGSLRSVLAQKYPHLTIMLLDQEEPRYAASAYIQKYMPEILHDKRVSLHRGKNLFHSGGHNILINRAIGAGCDYYMVASQDMLYAPNCISALVDMLGSKPYSEYRVFAPKLLKWEYAAFARGETKESKTHRIDSMGIGITHAHQFFEIGAGRMDGPQWGAPAEVFGPTGALAFLHVDALRAIRNGTEYFDELLHYKNDVDLAYRLQWAGYRTLSVPHAIAWHDRQVADRRSSFLQKIKDRKKVSVFARESSLFGQEAVLIKNYAAKASWRTHIATWIARSMRSLYMHVAERDALGAYARIASALPRLLANRSAAPHVVSARTIEHFMSHSYETII